MKNQIFVFLIGTIFIVACGHEEKQSVDHGVIRGLNSQLLETTTSSVSISEIQNFIRSNMNSSSVSSDKTTLLLNGDNDKLIQNLISLFNPGTLSNFSSLLDLLKQFFSGSGFKESLEALLDVIKSLIPVVALARPDIALIMQAVSIVSPIVISVLDGIGEPSQFQSFSNFFQWLSQLTSMIQNLIGNESELVKKAIELLLSLKP